MKYLTENNDLFMAKDKLQLHKDLVFSANQYKKFFETKSEEELQKIGSEMNKEIQLIQDNLDILKCKKSVIEEILKEKRGH